MTPPVLRSPHVAVACGGTGGHLFPGLAVAEQLQQRGVSISLLISPKEVDQEAVRSVRDMEVVTLPAVALQRGSRFGFVPGFIKSWIAAGKAFRRRRPAAVLAMGGFTAAPPVLEARRIAAKAFLHESNTIPGRANRWLSRLVTQASIGFPQAAARLRAAETTVTGTPVRPQFEPRHVAGARAALGLDSARPVVLVTGGSQGATGLNEMILAALPQLAARLPQVQWLHLTGARDEANVRRGYENLRLKAFVRPFLHEMELALAAATAVVSRSGASSLAELAAMRCPALLVPFPFAADNHQFHNARALAETGAAFLLEQSVASPDRVVPMLAELVENPVTREKMQLALGRWHTPGAAAAIAELILTSLHDRVSLAVRREQKILGKDQLNLSAIT